ncbi:MAG: hypothetical protein QM804_19125 [Propionicimonas sp.]
MNVFRKIIATSIAAGAIALSIGISQASAAPVVKAPGKSVVVFGGGQGNWPLGK